MPPIVVTAPQFLRLGLEIVGFPLRRQNGRHETNIQRFRDKFGPSPESCAAIFVDLQTTHIPEAQIAKPNVLYFLMALHWLKTYPTETGTAATFRVDEKTGRKFVWEYVLAVQALKAQKIVWIDFGPADETFPLTVDGVDCPLNEPRKFPNSKWYSKKFNGPGLSYELGIAIHENRLVWMTGPSFPNRDLATFKKPNGLKSKIPPGKKVIADKAYKDPVCAIKNPQDTPEVRRFKRRALARHETFNGRLKSYKVLSTKFRHGFKKHKAVFEAVCVIVQYELENGHPL